MEEKKNEIAYDIMRSAQLAAALEASGWPKPGNVHRTADFQDTRFEHFIAGAIALGSTIREAAFQGIRASLEEWQLSEMGIGRYIKKAVIEMKKWHRGGNTQLGTILLFVPLATAAGMTYIENGKIKPLPLQKNLTNIMKATTPRDAINVYEAILSENTKALGRLEKRVAPDLSNQEFRGELIEGEFTLYDVMKIASKWDTIAKELTTGMQICFETAYPAFLKLYKKTNDINITIVHTFLTLLSTFPDTFIARKVGSKETHIIERAVEIGIEKTRWITEAAENILKIGGLTTELGRKALFDFDCVLQRARGEYNPGTTADLTANALLIAFLNGFRF